MARLRGLVYWFGSFYGYFQPFNFYMKNKKHLLFYMQCMQTGYLPNKSMECQTGLCGAAQSFQIDKDLLDLFEPTQQDFKQLIGENESNGWWGYEVPCSEESYNATDEKFAFTTLRQTIVLFMAAINDEL